MRSKKGEWSIIKAVLLMVISGQLLFNLSTISLAVTPNTIATGLVEPIGLDLDETAQHLYFVESGTGMLKRLDLSPGASGAISNIATGFSHPVDVVLDPEYHFAYVTTCDDFISGGLWKVNIATGDKTLAAFNLGRPRQLVLDVANNQAYTVGNNDGRLRCIDLTTGCKKSIYKLLVQPVGLVITNDKQFVYVAENDTPPRISVINLATGVKEGEIRPVDLTAPSFLAWSDYSENSLYIAEGAPVNRISRIDLMTATRTDVTTGLTFSPSGIVVGRAATSIYAATSQTIIELTLALGTSEPGFMGVGHVPISAISDEGYATTDDAYFFKVKNAPFGGTLNIFGNLSNFKSLGATHYKVLVSKDGESPVPLTNSWNAYKWDPTDSEYKLVAVVPDPSTGKYAIPDEYPLNAAWWYPSFLIMRWPSGSNGLYTFSLELYDATGTDPIPVTLEELTVLIDNSPPQVEIQKIFQNKPPLRELEACVMANDGLNEFSFRIKAYDTEGHLHSWRLKALYANNRVLPIASDCYESHISPPDYTPVLWPGVINHSVAVPAPGLECNCAYTFYLWAWGRTTNGYNRTQYVHYHKSVTINIPSLSICP